MGLRSQFQVKMKQAAKRKKKRQNITGNGKDLKDFYYGKYYLKGGSTQS